MSAIRLVMAYDQNVPFGSHTEAHNRAYAQALGYDFHAYRYLPDRNLDPYWNRIRVFQQELSSCEVLWWIDADAIFLRRDELPSFSTDLAMSRDWNGICCGVMGLRNTAWNARLLDAWLLLGNVENEKIAGFDNGPFREQTTLKALCYFWPSIRGHVSAISEEVIQGFTSTYHPKALVLHMWASALGPERVLATLQKFLADGYQPDTLQRPP
jgi:hypothetical protein